MGELPTFTKDGIIKEEPIAILDRRLIKRRNQAVPEVSVPWLLKMPLGISGNIYTNSFQERTLRTRFNLKRRWTVTSQHCIVVIHNCTRAFMSKDACIHRAFRMLSHLFL
eukprot:TRINITY_DN18330_c0_g1_i1.p1 TRINITY_DN18330_c0_g1~~TRINITY_DN18330_c0_g1_i1.p1  ORF type:complete len:110 (+),score=5.82 TRINITY_DN18330_c0_g1_i1:581-910(+)